jgi:hypothetical protein
MFSQQILKWTKNDHVISMGIKHAVFGRQNTLFSLQQSQGLLEDRQPGRGGLLEGGALLEGGVLLEVAKKWR